jgi:cysteinyl-tRNA synthetase
MSIHIYNTLTHSKEPFIPGEEGKVKMYVCGPTTYNYIHLGNARPLVFFDTVRRYFSYRGYQVQYVQNFTDVDDKIIKRAEEEGTDPLALAQKYIEEFFQDAQALNVKPASVHPKVSEHIPDIVALIEQLIDKGFAYQVEGDVYFSVRSFEGYGKLSGRSLDELQAGARVEVDARKKDPLDFALWKQAKPGEPAWESPWGMGRPGWHIECSVMSLKYLGPHFDIHGGGADLVFPHHENEIAQSEAACGEPFAKYWMHNGFITVNQEKMSKSLGNFFLVREILAKFPADVVRFFLLETHYRSPLDFDDQKLLESKKALDRIKNTKGLLQEKIAFLTSVNANDDYLPEESTARKIEQCREEFIKAMDDDFNTSLALAAVFELCRVSNSFANQPDLPQKPGALGQLKRALTVLEEMVVEVLGIPLQREETARHNQDGAMVTALVELLIELRQEARAKKDWGTADGIRDRLKEIGIIIEDTPHGVRWKRAEQ